MEGELGLGFRSQSAMEYLMTYGWAILIIAVILGGLYSLGLFSGLSLAPRIPPGACHIFRPNGPQTVQYITLTGACTNQLPQYVAQFSVAQSSRILIPTSPSLQATNTITIALWEKSQGPAASAQQGMISDYGGTANSVTFFSPASHQFIFEVLSPTGSTGFGAGSLNISDNRWHHLVGTKVGNTVSTYIDGKLQGSSTTAATGNITNAYTWSIGTRPVQARIISTAR